MLNQKSAREHVSASDCLSMDDKQLGDVMKLRILFVDDEPNILQGLKRMLRTMRHEWEMQFAENGQDALEKLSKASFNVIVSDMRMPGMDGSQLLGEVRTRYPNIVRIILSGHSDKEMILKSVQPAHQYLTKPCDAEALKESVTRACSLKDLLGNDSLKHVISQMQSLPSLPSLYSEIMNELQSPDTSLDKIGRIISKDLGMTAKILHLVNSAFFGIPRHISSPDQAVSLLGLDTIKALVLTVGVFSKFDNTKVPGFSIKALWTHSIKIGASAKEIAKAENIDKTFIDDAYMAGLLHDVGKLVLSTTLGDPYKKAIELAQKQKIPLCDAEQNIIGTTHAEVGAYLLGLWGLPNSIIEAVAFHHRPQSLPGGKFNTIAAVHFANALEYEGNLNSLSNTPNDRLNEEYLNLLGLAEHLSVWREACRQIQQEEMND